MKYFSPPSFYTANEKTANLCGRSSYDTTNIILVWYCCGTDCNCCIEVHIILNLMATWQHTAWSNAQQYWTADTCLQRMHTVGTWLFTWGNPFSLKVASNSILKNSWFLFVIFHLRILDLTVRSCSKFKHSLLISPTTKIPSALVSTIYSNSGILCCTQQFYLCTVFVIRSQKMQPVLVPSKTSTNPVLHPQH